MLVQRKWMYLESIFIGGDIRSQLPEEAKKFDTIDRMFKKVTRFCFYVCVFFCFFFKEIYSEPTDSGNIQCRRGGMR